MVGVVLEFLGVVAKRFDGGDDVQVVFLAKINDLVKNGLQGKITVFVSDCWWEKEYPKIATVAFGKIGHLGDDGQKLFFIALEHPFVPFNRRHFALFDVPVNGLVDKKRELEKRCFVNAVQAVVATFIDGIAAGEIVQVEEIIDGLGFIDIIFRFEVSFQFFQPIAAGAEVDDFDAVTNEFLQLGGSGFGLVESLAERNRVAKERYCFWKIRLFAVVPETMLVDGQTAVVQLDLVARLHLIGKAWVVAGYIIMELVSLLGFQGWGDQNFVQDLATNF